MEIVVVGKVVATVLVVVPVLAVVLALVVAVVPSRRLVAVEKQIVAIGAAPRLEFVVAMPWLCRSCRDVLQRPPIVAKEEFAALDPVATIPVARGHRTRLVPN